MPGEPSARGQVGTRTNQGSRIDYISEKPYLYHQLGVPRAPIFGLLPAISWHWLRLACSDWPAGFKSTCVWSSKVLARSFKNGSSWKFWASFRPYHNQVYQRGVTFGEKWKSELNLATYHRWMAYVSGLFPWSIRAQLFFIKKIGMVI